MSEEYLNKKKNEAIAYYEMKRRESELFSGADIENVIETAKNQAV